MATSKKVKYTAWVVTPPPNSESIQISRALPLEEAREAAMKWADGGIHWTGTREGVVHTGERVAIEEARKVRAGESLSWPMWGEFFEAGVFERFLGPTLGFHLTQYGEVVRDERERFHEIWVEIERWLMDWLKSEGIEPYSIASRGIYKSDVRKMIRDLAPRPSSGPKDWDPSRKPWMILLSLALQTLLTDSFR